jgi:D-alanine-D-alanine ligase-like ATP-grasp enzyme
MHRTARLNALTLIDADRGSFDRGWDPADLIAALDQIRVPVEVVRVGSERQLLQAVEDRPGVAFWPLDYTFGPEPAGRTITEVLAGCGAPYLGCNPEGSLLTNKLLFKRALIAAEFATPAWEELDGSQLPAGWERYPAYVKSEFSCDSAGVRRVALPRDVQPAVATLSRRFPDHRVFIEEEAGGDEWTIAGAVVQGSPIISALGFSPRSSDYIDAAAKCDNSKIEFSVPPPAQAGRLQDLVANLSARLQLSGYFRVDVVATANGDLQGIDLNILPCLNSAASQLSYLPMAYMSTRGCDYLDVVGLLLATIEGGPQRYEAGSTLRTAAEGSSLLTWTEAA